MEKSKITTPIAIIIAGFLVMLGIIISKSPSAGTQVASAKTISAQVGLNAKSFNSCLTSSKYKDAVEADVQSGKKAGVTGTPMSFILTKDGKIFSVNGALPFEDAQYQTDMKRTIDGILAGTKTDTVTVDLAPVTGDDYALGDPSAALTIIEYSDLECPFCKTFHATMQRVFDAYPGQIYWVYRHFPLDSIHPKARKEAEAAECAGELKGNDAFWKYIDTLFEQTPSNNGFDLNLL